MSSRRKPRLYISGPMRGIPENNVPAFDKAAEAWEKRGWDVTNPAELDRAYNYYDQRDQEAYPDDTRIYVQRDINILLDFRASKGDAIAVLPGWWTSLGAKAEVAVAKWMRLAVLDAEKPVVPREERLREHREQVKKDINAFYPPRPSGETHTGGLRRFATGATRDTDDNKIVPTGYLSPLAIHEFSRYMREHQVQSDGTKRTADNWKKGIPDSAYFESLGRHFLELWLATEYPNGGPKVYEQESSNWTPQRRRNALCGILFNAMGLLHSWVKGQRKLSN